MYHSRVAGGILLRLDQGEELIRSLVSLAKGYDHDFYVIASGVGMIEGLRLGFFCINDADYDVQRISGALDLSSVSGNLALREGEWWPHVHIVANKPDFSTVSGHVIEAKAHITMELLLLAASDTMIKRQALSGYPATILVSEK